MTVRSRAAPDKARAQITPLVIRKHPYGRASVVLTLTDAEDLPRTEELVRSVCYEVHVEEPARRITAAADGLADMNRIGEVIAEAGIPVDDLGLQRPSLDDVFLHLTGHRAEDETDREAGESESDAGSQLEGAIR